MYDDLGRVIRTERVRGLQVEVYDAGGRWATRIKEGTAGGIDVLSYSETGYDDVGRVKYTVSSDDTGAADGPRTDYYYDDAGRQVAVLGPEVSADIDGDGTEETVRALTEYVYDAAGRQTAVTTDVAVLHTTTDFSTHPDLDTADIDNSGGQTTHHEYDAIGRRKLTTDPEGNTTTWVYDALGRCVEETNELNHTEYYRYDDYGNLIYKTDRNDRVTTYIYGNQIAEEWLDSQQNVIETFSYTYDATGNLLTASDSTADYAFIYDDYGRAMSITVEMAGLAPTVVLSRDYDDCGRLSQVAAAIGGTNDLVNEYTHNAFGLLASVQQHGVGGGNAVAEKLVDFAYNGVLLLETITRYADLTATSLVATSTYAHNASNWVTSLTHVKGPNTLAGCVSRSGSGLSLLMNKR